MREKNFLSLCIEIILLLYLVILSIDNGLSKNVEATMRIVGFLAVITAIVLCILLFVMDRHVHFFFYFLVFSFLFSFGQCLLIFFGNEVASIRLLSVNNGILSASDIYNSSLYILKGIVLMTIGFTCAHRSKINKERSFQLINSVENTTALCATGWIFFIASVVPAYYISVTDVINIQLTGYASTLTNYSGIDKIFSVISGFFVSGIIILILTESRKWGRIIYWTVVGGYLFLQLAGGSRIQAFRFAILLVAIYFAKQRTLKLGSVLKISIILLMVGFVFSVISMLRIYQGDISSIEDLLLFIDESFEQQNLFYKVFYECGITQNINATVYKHCPNSVDYCYGSHMINMFLSAVPNIGLWDTHPAAITTDSTFSGFYTNAIGLGSSVFAEAYWNFSEFGAYIFLICFGVFFAWLVKKERMSLRRGDVVGQFIVYYIFYFCIFLVRTDFLQFGRMFVYYACVPLVVMYFVKKRYKKIRTN